MTEDTILWAWLRTARRVLENLDEIPVEHRLWVGDLMQRQTMLVSELAQAEARGDVALVKRLSIQLGSAMGRWGEQPWVQAVEVTLAHTEHELAEAHDELIESRPHARRGRKVKAGASKGGHKRKGKRKRPGPDDATLKAEVHALMKKGASHRSACKQVARKHPPVKWETLRKKTA